MPFYIRKEQQWPEPPAQRGPAWSPERGFKLPHPPIPENMAALSDITVRGAKQMHRVSLDYSIDSLAWVDQLLNSFGREGSHEMAEMVLCAGAYLGEVLVRNHSFEWVVFPNDVARELRFSTGIEAGGVRGNPLGIAFDVVDHGHPEYSTLTLARHLVADAQEQGED